MRETTVENICSAYFKNKIKDHKDVISKVMSGVLEFDEKSNGIHDLSISYHDL